MNIIHFDELNSTNKYAKENFHLLNNFDVIITDRQTSGYGQWGRKWIDTGCDNIYLSVILKPDDLSKHTDIVRFMAICICEIFLKYSVLPHIKEPNDILIKNKKIAGILAESITKGDKLMGIVIGVGINLNTDKIYLEKINQPATSLNLEIGKFTEKKEFINYLLSEFEDKYPLFLKNEVNLNLFL